MLYDPRYGSITTLQVKHLGHQEEGRIEISGFHSAFVSGAR
jgi:hypothetical protein